MDAGNKRPWYNNTLIRQVVFQLIILYTVSSMNVLILAISLLPVLEGASLRTPVLSYFAVISFVIVVVLSIYHVYLMFFRQKRITDNKTEKVRVKEAIKRSRILNIFLLVIIIIYMAFSVYFLLSSKEQIFIALYAILSFAVAILIAAMHLVTLILRRKRKSDK